MGHGSFFPLATSMVTLFFADLAGIFCDRTKLYEPISLITL